MKLCNIMVEEQVHLGVLSSRGVIDANAAGCKLCMDEVIAGADLAELRLIEADGNLPIVAAPKYANVVNKAGKLLCVGLNYRDHAESINAPIPQYPVLFSKFNDALAPSGAMVDLPTWERSYDYEAELVIVIGKSAWGVCPENAMDYIFGYTCGNDLSCREPQMRSGQWLIGKTMPGFGPCGPHIVTADCFNPDAANAVKSYVNGELRQNGSTSDMIFNCAQIVSYASKYVHLEPGDLIFTGTPSGVSLEKDDKSRSWLEAGDVVEVEIDGIGSLSNLMC